MTQEKKLSLRPVSEESQRPGPFSALICAVGAVVDAPFPAQKSHNWISPAITHCLAKRGLKTFLSNMPKLRQTKKTNSRAVSQPQNMDVRLDVSAAGADLRPVRCAMLSSVPGPAPQMHTHPRCLPALPDASPGEGIQNRPR